MFTTVKKASTERSIIGLGIRQLSAIAFPGQGTQQNGMLKPFYKQNEQTIKRVLDECDEALNEKFSPSLTDDTQTKINVDLTHNAQPFLLAYGYAIYQLIKNQSEFKYVLGHSLGEYTAWTAAGVLNFGDAIKLVRERGLAMQTAAAQVPECGMATLLLLKNNVEEIMPILNKAIEEEEKVVSLAITSADKQIVLSGDKQAILNVSKKLGRVKMKPLNVSGAFHSPIMIPAQEKMRQLVSTISFNWPPNYNIISNMTASIVLSKQEIENSVVETLVHPVYWQQSIKYLENDKEIDTVYQIGEGKYVKSACSKNSLLSVEYVE